MFESLRVARWALLILLSMGCGTPIHTQPIRFGEGAPAPVHIPGFDGCGQEGQEIVLDPTKPLVVLVHGCNSSSGRFRTLAGVFEAHGQQAICFTYDDRDSLEASSAELMRGVRALEPHMENRRLTVLGHSQGGLIARRALVDSRSGKVAPASAFDFQVVTISSPFNGIEASSHCSLVGLHVASLGVSVLLCRAIAGEKWREIHEDAAFMREPGVLTDDVSDYIKIVTDERESCRSYDSSGECIEDDYVFSVEEQYNPDVDGDARVRNVEVQAGHVEIVGNRGEVPVKLLNVLTTQGILDEVPQTQLEAVARIVVSLYSAS